MTRRALATTFGIGWLALVAMRLGANVTAAAPGRSLWQLAMVVVPITSFWIPVIAVILWIDRRRRPLWMAHVPLMLLVPLAEAAVVRAVLAAVGTDRPYLGILTSRFDTNILIYLVIVFASRTIRHLEAFRARERAAARLEQVLADAQLHALAIQLQPHFLFNALQFVAETAHHDLPVARRTLHHLRGLVRQAFALEQRVEVLLRDELAFLAAYGEIQKSRFGDRFRLVIDATPDVLDALVPPLLLQPLVENAARHGFGSRGSGGEITVTARRVNGELSIVVRDDGVGIPAHIREGQGLSVTRRRLERLHGDSASLTLAREGSMTNASLRFPFREASPPPLHPEVSHDHVSADEGGSEIMSQRWPLAVRVVAFWAALLAMVTIASAAVPLFAAIVYDRPYDFPRLFIDMIVGLPFWAVMSLAVLLVGRRLGGAAAVALHVALAIAITGMHIMLGDDFRRALFGQANPRAYEGWATWDMLAYAALVLLARAHDLREWVRAKAREEVALSAEVRAANERLDRLREMQSRLLGELDAVIASPTMESLDRAVVEFADFLRGEVIPDAVSTTV